MKKVLCCVAVFIGSMMTVSASVVNYTADNTTVFKNPERGFTEEMSKKVSASNPNVVVGEVDEEWGVDECRTLAMVLYNFNNFKSKNLPQAVLDGFDEDMQELRNYGLKCVLRFAYTEKQSDKNDATPAWVKTHLEQLKPHLEANADVIYVLEAGFVGVWGEWYYTSNYGNKSQHMNQNRRQVIQYLFENAPEDRFILFRYPLLKIEYFDSETALTPAEGFSGSTKARWGCHNDAFLNEWGNDGTYGRDGDGPSDDPLLRQFIADETLYVPNGGETNVEDDELAEEVYTQAPEEMRTYHWSFCGTSYAEEVTGRWRSSGIYDTLNIYMGYRYNLLDGQYSDEVAAGEPMSVNIRIRNVGYAPLYNERPVYVVLKAVSGQPSAISIPLQADPRRWLPDGAISTINEQVTIPSEVPEGTYHLYLWMPDKYASLASDPRYAVRFANSNVWDENTGYNDLGADVTVTAPMPDGVEATMESSVVLPRKMMENGTMYILMPDGKRYNALGQTM